MRREGRTHWRMERLEMTAVTLLLRLVCSKTGRKTLRRKTMSLRISFSSLKTKWEQHETFYVVVYEKWLLLGKVTLLWNLPFMAIRCVTVRVLWCGESWCEGKKDLYGKHTHTHTNTQLLFCSSGEGPRVQTHTHRHTRREENWAGWGGQTTAPLANMFGSLVNISFDNTGWRVNSEHL